MLGLKSQLCHSLVIIIWASQLTCLDINFLICKMGLILPLFVGLLGVVPQHLQNNKVGVTSGHSAQCLPITNCPPQTRSESVVVSICCMCPQKGEPPVTGLAVPISLSSQWCHLLTSFLLTSFLRWYFISVV